MVLRTTAALAAIALWISSGAAAGASGTVVITKLGGKPQTVTGARLVLKASTLAVTLPDKRELDFGQNSCQNTVEIMQCNPIGVTLRNKSGAHDVDFDNGVGYFNLTKVPQTIPTSPPQTLPRNGLSIVLNAADGTIVTIRGTLDVGVLAGH
jgi:hypothetical protein